MTKTAFTPGPWWVPKGYDRPGVAVAINSDPHPIASAYFVNGQANAHLIAAAPCLYEAAYKALDLLRSSRAKGKGPTDAEASLMLALRKARGEQR